MAKNSNEPGAYNYDLTTTYFVVLSGIVVLFFFLMALGVYHLGGLINA